MKKGYVHVYTGNGKGKTTAALGMALRAAGAGLNVFIAQFVKSMEYSEIKALKRFDDCITVKQYGQGCFIENGACAEDIAIAQKGLSEVKSVLASDRYQVVILDEAAIAVHFNLFSDDELLAALGGRHESAEVIVTGRYASEALIRYADLVTNMQEIKHYYTHGVIARRGIEK